MNQKKSIALTTTFVGLVCGFVLTQQQAAAAATNASDPTTTSIVSPQSTAATTSAKPAEPTQKEQTAVQQTSLQDAVTNAKAVNKIANHNETPVNQSPGDFATTTAAQSATANINPMTSVQSQQETVVQNTAALSSASSATNKTTQPASQPVISQAVQESNSSNTASTTKDSQVETIAQGTWGTSNWEYTHQGADYILHFHAGTLGASSHGEKITNDGFYHILGSIGASSAVFNGNWNWNDELTQIVIDPGVIANEDASYLFAELSHLSKIIGLENLDTSHVTQMRAMFKDCAQLTGLDLNHWNTTQVTSMDEMFYGCQNLATLALENFQTAHVVGMHQMFAACRSLTKLDLSHFNTAKVIYMDAMFENCTQLVQLSLNNFTTAQAIYLEAMFKNCINLRSLDLSSFDMSSVPYVDDMFANCDSLTHLVLGVKTILNPQMNLPRVPKLGFRVPGTDRVVASPYWVATSGYQQGHKYTSGDLMELTGRDQVTTYDWDSKPAFTQTTETKTKIRAINLHQPNGQLKTEIQTVAVSRPVTINPDGSKTCGAWTTAQWDQYTVPEWAGYQASQKQVPAITVSGDSANTTIDIYYQPLLQNVEIQYLDQGKVVGTQTITGYTGQTLMPNYQAPQGYEIVAAAPATITIDATGHQIIQVQVAHKINNSTEFNALTRTVNIHLPDGTMKTYIQTAVLKRNVYIDGVTGAKTYGAWSTDNWDAVQIPVFAGYTASQEQIAAQAVDSNTTDQTINIFYTPQEQTVEIQYLDHDQIVGTQKITGYTGDTIMPNYHAPQGYEITSITPATITIDGSGKQIVQVNVSHKQETSVEYKTVIRTINLHQINGQMKTYKQMVLLQRGVQMDAVTGNKTYGQWNTGNWNALDVPVLDGYTASQDQVAAQQVTDQDSDQTVDVYYTPTN